MWKDTEAFYLDGVSFCYKTNPADQASAPYGCIWRGCSKSKAEGDLGISPEYLIQSDQIMEESFKKSS